MKKRPRNLKNRYLAGDKLREKWRRELARRRVDAQGMEPIRLRVRKLLRRHEAGSQKP